MVCTLGKESINMIIAARVPGSVPGPGIYFHDKYMIKGEGKSKT